MNCLLLVKVVLIKKGPLLMMKPVIPETSIMLAWTLLTDVVRLLLGL